MKLSVIIPFVDEARALPETLSHLMCEVATCRDVEVIAVDAGSRDGSRGFLPRIRACACSMRRAGARRR